MSDKVTIKLVGPEQRKRAYDFLLRAPADYVVTIAPPTRTLDQNAKMWAMLSDIAKAKPEGRDWSTEQWKAVFMDACGHQAEFSPKLDGPGFICLGFKSSHLSKAQFAELIECITEYGSRFDVRWSEPSTLTNEARRAA